MQPYFRSVTTVCSYQSGNANESTKCRMLMIQYSLAPLPPPPSAWQQVGTNILPQFKVQPKIGIECEQENRNWEKMTTKNGVQKTKCTQNWITKNVWRWQVATFPFHKQSYVTRAFLCHWKKGRTNTQRYLNRRKYICNRRIGHYSIFRSFS